MDRFMASLNQFEAGLDVTRESIKRKLIEFIDRRFDLVKQDVHQLKTRAHRHIHSKKVPTREQKFSNDDGPPMETVSKSDCVKHCEDIASLQTDVSIHYGSRKRIISKPQSDARKRFKKSNQMLQNVAKNRCVCKFQGCGKTFPSVFNLAMHERIHLDIKPYSCTWSNCQYSSEQYGNVIRHIRIQHFKLPQTFKAQEKKNIVDNRDPNEYVRVDEELAKRRL